MRLTTYLHPMPKLGMSGVILLFPPWTRCILPCPLHTNSHTILGLSPCGHPVETFSFTISMLTSFPQASTIYGPWTLPTGYCAYYHCRVQPRYQDISSCESFTLTVTTATHTYTLKELQHITELDPKS